MEPPSPGITVINQSGRRVRTSQLRQAASLALQRHGLAGEVSVLLTDDDHIRSLNRDFRGVDEATDVLTFPSSPPPSSPTHPPTRKGASSQGSSCVATLGCAHGTPSGLSVPAAEGSTYLGDIAISVPYAERQARARGVSLSQELAYLAIHGALHIAGHEDEEDDDRARMVAEMNEVAKAAGLKADEQWWSILHGETV